MLKNIDYNAERLIESFKMNKFYVIIMFLLFAASFSEESSIYGQKAAVAGPANSTQTGDVSNLATAEALLNAGKTEEALEILKALPEAQTKGGRINYLLGLAYYQKNDFARSINYLTIAAQQLQPGSQQLEQNIQLLGLAHYFLGHLKEALPLLEKAHIAAPDDVEVSYVLGNTYIQTHVPDKARQIFAGVFNLSPQSAAAFLVNAQMMIHLQFEELAEKELQRALELDPKLPQANFMLGEMAIFHADIDRGISLLQKEIALNPSFGMAYYRLGEAYTRQLKWDEARAPLQKSIWLNPYFSGPYIVLGKVYLKKQDIGNAESILRRALQMDPNNYSGHHLLAQVLQQSNRPDEARKEFEVAEKLRTAGKE